MKLPSGGHPFLFRDETVSPLSLQKTNEVLIHQIRFILLRMFVIQC